MFEKLQCYPIAFTRPYRRLLDYQFFVCPASFRKNQDAQAFVKAWIANHAVADYRDGRWCVFCVDDRYIVCGKVTLKYNRFDEYGRGPICGFYGLVMERVANVMERVAKMNFREDSLVIPAEEYFDWIDTQFIEPHFNDKELFCQFVNPLDVEACPLLSLPRFKKSEVKSMCDALNDDEGTVKIFPQMWFDLKTDLMLFAALNKARDGKGKKFAVITSVDEGIEECLRLGYTNVFSPRVEGVQSMKVKKSEGGMCVGSCSGFVNRLFGRCTTEDRCKH